MSCELSAISYVYPACPVALEDGTGVEYLPSEMCNLFHRGFARNELARLNLRQ